MNRLSKTINILPNWLLLIIYLGSVFCYSMLIGIQGFDMCDEGWVLSGYQQIFRCPSSNAYLLLYYNTQLIGGCWNLIFGSFGIIGFRLLAALTRTIIAFLIYRLLKNYISYWAIFLGVALVIINEPYLMVFHHNQFTALLVVLSVLWFCKGLTRSSKMWMFLTGIIMGVNIFSRIPNISMFSLFLVFVPYYLYNRNLKQTFTLLGYAICGVVAGVGFNIFIMLLLKHFNIFYDNISSGMSAASAYDSTHNLSRVFNVYFSNYKSIIKQIGLVLSFPLICFISKITFRNPKIVKTAIIIVGLLYAVAIWKFSGGTFMLYAFSYTVLLSYAVCFHREQNLIFLITLSVCVLFFLPFGSDYGVGNMGSNCIWISTPLSIGLLFKIITNTSIVTDIRTTTSESLLIFSIVFILSGLYQTKSGCYFDDGSRLMKTTRPKAALATTFTTKEKCNQLDTLISHLSIYVQQGDYLLAFQTIPMINYLTETRPYLGNSWVWTYDSSNLERQFIKSEQTIKNLPVIVWNKSGIASWNVYDKDWDNINSSDQWNFNKRKIQLMNEFVEKHNYKIVWENNLFQIMIVSN